MEKYLKLMHSLVVLLIYSLFFIFFFDGVIKMLSEVIADCDTYGLEIIIIMLVIKYRNKLVSFFNFNKE